MDDLTHRGVLNMPSTRRQRLMWASRAFWKVLHGQPAASVALGDGYLDIIQFDGPIVVHPYGPEGKFRNDLHGTEATWHVGWDGHRWVRT